MCSSCASSSSQKGHCRACCHACFRACFRVCGHAYGTLLRDDGYCLEVDAAPYRYRGDLGETILDLACCCHGSRLGHGYRGRLACYSTYHEEHRQHEGREEGLGRDTEQEVRKELAGREDPRKVVHTQHLLDAATHRRHKVPEPAH